MKTKLLKKVRNGIFATKVSKFGYDMYKISSTNGMGSDNGIYCITKEITVDILRELRLEAARNILQRKTERRLSL